MKIKFDDIQLGGGPFYLDENFNRSFGGETDNVNINIPRTDYTKNVADYLKPKIRAFSGTLVGNNTKHFRDLKRDFVNKLRTETTFTIVDDVVNPVGTTGDNLWWNASWSKRRKLTINANQIAGDITNYVCYIDLSDLGSDFFSNVKTDGSDIAVIDSDNATLLERELVSIDTVGETGELWVKIPNLENATAKTIYLYFNNPGTTLNNSTTVWDSNYKMIQHMNDLTASTIADSTTNGNDGTKFADDEPIEATGILGKAQDFDGTNDEIIYAYDADSLAFSGNDPITISCWVNLDTFSGSDWFLAQGTEIVLARDTSNRAQFILNSFTTNDRVVGGTLSTLTDHYLVGRYDGVNLEVFLDGVSVGTVVPTGTYGGITNDFITSQNLGRVDGKVDELRVSDIARSDELIETEYNNQSDTSTFFTITAIENFDPDSYSYTYAEYEFDGKIVDVDANDDFNSNRSKWAMQISAPDPTLKLLPTIDIELALGVTGFSFPLTFPFVFTSDSNTITINNLGDAITYPFIQLFGSFENITIVNQTEGFVGDTAFTYTGTVPAPQILELNPTPIDPIKARISGTSVLQNTNSNFDVFKIQPGINVFTIVAETGIDDSTKVIFSFNSSFYGI